MDELDHSCTTLNCSGARRNRSATEVIALCNMHKWCAPVAQRARVTLRFPILEFPLE